MEAATAGEPRRFDHLREHSIGLTQVLFQSITHMAPAAAVAYSIFISVQYSQQALLLWVGLALIASSRSSRRSSTSSSAVRGCVEDETVAPEAAPAPEPA